MTDQRVTVQRRNWFRFFPEGSIEFTVITRVLAVMMLAALLIIPGTQQAQVLLVLVGLLWLDYALVLWWLVQLSCDLEDLFAAPPPMAGPARTRRIRTALLVILPSVPLLILLAPWPAFFINREATRAAVLHALVPVMGLLFLGLAFIAQRTLQRARLGPPLWTLLLLVPLVHWFALHRLMPGLGARLRERAAPGAPADGGRSAIVIADLMLVLSAACWAGWLLLSWQAGDAPGMAPGALRLLAIATATLFGVADVAAMENLQRPFVALIRKL